MRVTRQGMRSVTPHHPVKKFKRGGYVVMQCALTRKCEPSLFRGACH